MLAAVDRQCRPRDEPGIITYEENNAAGNFISAPETPDGNTGNNLFQHVPGDGGDHLRVNITRRYRVHGDSLGGTFLRQRLGKSVNAGFCGGVIDLTVLARLTIDRADVHD